MSMDVRRACLADWLAIKRLNRTAHRTLPDLWRWEEHLADDAFVVVEREGTLAGALFACPDDSPVAWVRLAVVADALDVGEWLDATLSPLVAGLRPRAQTLAWMDYGGWAGAYLYTRGFDRLADVVTLAKRDRALPAAGRKDVVVRPAWDADVPAIVAVDRAAFAPLWQFGQATLRRLLASSSHFAVAELAGEVVGYAEGTLHLPQAHLDRIAVHPAHQGRGVGVLLLRDALRAFWRMGAEHVTLNTQSDNRPSQHLYGRFGFETTGESVPSWEIDL